MLLGKNAGLMKLSLYQLYHGHFSPSPGQEPSQTLVIHWSSPFGINRSFHRCKNEVCAQGPWKQVTLRSEKPAFPSASTMLQPRARRASRGSGNTARIFRLQMRELVCLLQLKREGSETQSRNAKTNVLTATLLISTAAQAVFRKARNETSECNSG